MDMNTMRLQVYEMNPDELFYQEYYELKKEGKAIEPLIQRYGMNEIHRRHLIVPEIEETIPPQYEDVFFFDLTDADSIIVQKHNRYSPALFHKHTFFEILYVYDGSCKQKLEQNNYILSTGDLCIIPPGIRHSITVNDESIVINVLIRRDTLHSIFHSFLNVPNILSSFFLNNIYSKQKNDYIIFHSGNDQEIRRDFLYMLLESINKEKCYYQIISNVLMLIFGLLIRGYEHTIEMPMLSSQSELQCFNLLSLIQKNSSTITLNDIAKYFHYTPEYTSKLIKQITGMTLTDILLQIRMEKAQDYLVNTNLPVASICEEIGYESPEYFVRLFKKYTGESPSAYRKRHASQTSAEGALK